MNKLKKLDISNTDISEADATKLPSNLKEIEYSTELRPNCKLTTLIPWLDKHFGEFNRCLKCLQKNKEMYNFW